jgi:hypothetical protein
MGAESGAMKIDGRFLPLPDDFLTSPAFAECPSDALKVLLAIGQDWVRRGFKDNGDLIVSYKMLTFATGINSKRILGTSLKQLVALGLLRMKNGNFGNRTPNRYGLTWLPNHNGSPPMKEYLQITSREEAKRRIEGLKGKRGTKKFRVIIEIEDL